MHWCIQVKSFKLYCVIKQYLKMTYLSILYPLKKKILVYFLNSLILHNECIRLAH